MFQIHNNHKQRWSNINTTHRNPYETITTKFLVSFTFTSFRWKSYKHEDIFTDFETWAWDPSLLTCLLDGSVLCACRNF